MRSEKERMNEGRPIYNLPFLPGANRPEVEKTTVISNFVIMLPF